MAIIAGVPLTRRVHSAYARARLTEALHDAALDAIHPAVGEITSRDERTWLRDALEGPIGVAVEAALDVLAAELEDAFHDAPESLLGKIDATPRHRVLEFG